MRHYRYEKRAYYIPKIGDFVCLNSPAVHNYDMTDPRWQAIGRVQRIDVYSHVMYILLPQNKFTSCYQECVRKASAYEGMMAFWDPEEETRRFFANEEIEVVDKKWIAAHQKVEQSNLTVEDF